VEVTELIDKNWSLDREKLAENRIPRTACNRTQTA